MHLNQWEANQLRSVKTGSFHHERVRARESDEDEPTMREALEGCKFKKWRIPINEAIRILGEMDWWMISDKHFVQNPVCNKLALLKKRNEQRWLVKYIAGLGAFGNEEDNFDDDSLAPAAYSTMETIVLCTIVQCG